MQQRKRSDTVTNSSPRKYETEATKGMKNFGTKPSYSPALPLLCVAKEERTRRFQGESFLFPENCGESSRWRQTHPPFAPTFPGRCSTKSGCRLRAEGAGARWGTSAQLKDHPQIPKRVFGPVTTENQGSWQGIPSMLLLSSPLAFFSLPLLQHDPAYMKQTHSRYQV